MKKLSFVFIPLLLALAACGQAVSEEAEGGFGRQISVPGGAYTDVSVAEFQSMLEDNDFLLVNVHVPFEGDIPGTDVSIPYDQIADHLDELPPEKAAKIVLYCRSDRMSGIASETLVGLGYTDVYNLDGGFAAWSQAGLPLEGN